MSLRSSKDLRNVHRSNSVCVFPLFVSFATIRTGQILALVPSLDYPISRHVHIRHQDYQIRHATVEGGSQLHSLRRRSGSTVLLGRVRTNASGASKALYTTHFVVLYERKRVQGASALSLAWIQLSLAGFTCGDGGCDGAGRYLAF